MATSFDKLATTILAICAVLVTVIVLKRELFPPEAVSGVTTTPVAGWDSVVRVGHRFGSAGAPAQVVVFSDFQCPACRMFATVTWPAVARKFSGKVALVVRHWPLPYHPHARMAGMAAGCAERQGRFAPMHDLLFLHQDSLGLTPWQSFAFSAGVPDTIAFQECLSAQVPAAAIDRDIAAAAALGGSGTPTVLLNGRMFSHPPDSNRLFRDVEKILQGKRLQ